VKRIIKGTADDTHFVSRSAGAVDYFDGEK
jgi:hypothetical protein